MKWAAKTNTGTWLLVPGAALAFDLIARMQLGWHIDFGVVGLLFWLPLLLIGFAGGVVQLCAGAMYAARRVLLIAGAVALLLVFDGAGALFEAGPV